MNTTTTTTINNDGVKSSSSSSSSIVMSSSSLELLLRVKMGVSNHPSADNLQHHDTTTTTSNTTSTSTSTSSTTGNATTTTITTETVPEPSSPSPTKTPLLLLLLPFSVRDVLTWTESMHRSSSYTTTSGGGGGGGNTSTSSFSNESSVRLLPLRSLVPIHTSLLEAVLRCNNSTTNSTTFRDMEDDTDNVMCLTVDEATTFVTSPSPPSTTTAAVVVEASSSLMSNTNTTTTNNSTVVATVTVPYIWKLLLRVLYHHKNKNNNIDQDDDATVASCTQQQQQDDDDDDSLVLVAQHVFQHYQKNQQPHDHLPPPNGDPYSNQPPTHNDQQQHQQQLLLLIQYFTMLLIQFQHAGWIESSVSTVSSLATFVVPDDDAVATTTTTTTTTTCNNNSNNNHFLYRLVAFRLLILPLVVVVVVGSVPPPDAAAASPSLVDISLVDINQQQHDDDDDEEEEENKEEKVLIGPTTKNDNETDEEAQQLLDAILDSIFVFGIRGGDDDSNTNTNNSNSSDSSTNTTTNHEGQSQPVESPATTTTTNHHFVLSLHWIQSCLDYIIDQMRQQQQVDIHHRNNNNNNTKYHRLLLWKRSCHIVRRFIHFVIISTTTNNIATPTTFGGTATKSSVVDVSVQEIVVHALTTIIQLSISITVQRRGDNSLLQFDMDDLSKILLPLVTDVLPIYTDHLQRLTMTAAAAAATTTTKSSIVYQRDNNSKKIKCVETMEKNALSMAAVVGTTKCVWQLWTFIWEHYNPCHHSGIQNSESNADSSIESLQSVITPVMSVITSILCSLLPNMIAVVVDPNIHRPSIVVNDEQYHSHLNDDDDDHRQPTGLLLSLIQQCLKLGLLHHVENRGGGGRRRRGGRATITTTNGIGMSSQHDYSINNVSSSCNNHVDVIRLYQLHRRRGIYLLRVLVEHCSTLPVDVIHPNSSMNVAWWRKYVSCFEIVEMESEQHLIDQVWETVTELFVEVQRMKTFVTLEQQDSCPQDGTEIYGRQRYLHPTSRQQTLPIITWDWMKLLLGRILVSQDLPILRKLSLFRLLKGQAGIRIDFSGGDDDAENGQEESSPIVPIKKGFNNNKQQISGKTKSSVYLRGAPLSTISVDFLFTVIISSFDTLMSSVGTNMQATAAVLSGNKPNAIGNKSANASNVAVSEDMIPLLCTFLRNYIHHLLLMKSTVKDENDSRTTDQVEEFFRKLWSADIVDGVHHKITVSIFDAIALTLRQHSDVNRKKVPIRDDMLRTIYQSLQLAFSDGSMVSSYKNSLLTSLAAMLECSSGIGFQTPLVILDVLSLYPLPMLKSQLSNGDEVSMATDDDSVLLSLGKWLKNGVTLASHTGTIVGATVATAFVDGSLQLQSINEATDWNIKSGCSDRERNLAKAIVLFCVLSYCDRNQTTVSEALWPAIHKGLSHASLVTLGGNWMKADRVSRALLLLDLGVSFRVLSGLGNGDLVVDKRTQNILPPPQNIDEILGTGATFIFHHVKCLISVKSNASELVQCDTSSKATRSSDARVLSVTFAKLVEQLQSLSNGFPSSLTIANIIGNVLAATVATFLDDKNEATRSSRALDIALIFMAVKSKGEIQTQKTVTVAETILRSQFDESNETGGNVQAVRSIFQFSKWGALSCILTTFLRDIHRDIKLSDINPFLDELFETAAMSVESTPATALVPLFDCIVKAAEVRFGIANEVSGIDDYRQFDNVIQALFGLVDACDSNSDSIFMIDRLCALIFQPALMMKEYSRFLELPDSETPIRDAFRRLMNISGTERPHISRIVISRICACWLKTKEIGLTAIPYRDTIVQLLVHKEDIVPVTSLFTYDMNSTTKKEIELVANTNETSISRGFLLVFFSKLPDHPPSTVQVDLIHYIIVKLMHLVTRPPTGSGLIMYGTPEYCVKIRALQALCVLSRFVTDDITDEVCTGLFETMGKQTSHNQIRYFLEVFTLRFARKHAAIFSLALVEQIRRTDLSLQMIASLMIISGNLIVGRYKDEFFQQYNREKDATVDEVRRINLHSILAGVVPWLSSTQGFSRAIAQLLAHKLIPLVIDVNNLPTLEIEDSHWYLRSLYRFLDENPEMKRLRKKQEQFFERYEVDSVCTPEGLFAIPVDEGQEANPVHMIEIIKECLQEVYDDANIDRAPLWKQIEVATTATTSNDIQHDVGKDDDGDVNFQRKIIPIDELNLAMDDIRDQKHRNKIGRRKQNLIVCASLIDKVPNLGGLARTCEIFAASKLIVPDIQVVKMDNFKNLCVGAADWIDIEECKEQNLLAWLRQRREDGYNIVGLEQTSSSQSLLDYTFPKASTHSINGGGTVLLLGKEKEGIPIEYIQMVDQCLEIPQYGIIRSLNVHVSGAIAIWEYTKQQQRMLHKPT